MITRKSSLPAIRKMTVRMVDMPSEASGAALGGLEQAIESLQEAIGLPGLRPGHDAFQVVAHEVGDLLHRLDLGAHDAGAPMLKHGAHDVDLLALEDLAQLLLVDPGAGGAHRGHPGDQSVEVGRGLRRQAGAILEQRPAHAFEGAVGALLDATHLVHGGAGMPDDVELVEGDAGVGQLLAATLDERRRHVDAHRADLLGRTAAAGQLAASASTVSTLRPSATASTRRSTASAARVM